MPTFIFATSDVSNSTRAVLFDGDDLFIAAGATVGNTVGVAIATGSTPTGPNGNHRAVIDGNLVGDIRGLDLGYSTDDVGQQLVVRSGGQVIGNTEAGALVVGSGSAVDNAGAIYGGSNGLVLATSRAAGPTTVARVTNFGVIEGGSRAVTRNLFGETETLELTNTGTLKGAESFNAIASLGANEITNSGTMIGDVLLGSGQDLYDGRLGKLVGTAFGVAGSDTLYGGAEDNVFDGGADADTMAGGRGNDRYFVDNGADKVFEAAGGGTADVVFASASYALGAGQQVETLATVDKNAGTAINLNGNEFRNTLSGNAGRNVLNGLGNNDTLIGNAGKDSFAFSTALGAGNVDTIGDFAAVDDTIVLFKSVFANLSLGVLGANFFKEITTGAQDANDRILYNRNTGALFYDADGAGGVAATQFATLANRPVDLSAADFVVV